MEEQNNLIVRNMKKGYLSPWKVFLLIKTAIAFIVAGFLLCPYSANIQSDGFIFSFYFKAYIVFFWLFCLFFLVALALREKKSHSNLASRIAVASSLTDLFFFIFLGSVSGIFNNFLFFFFALIVMEAALAFDKKLISNAGLLAVLSLLVSFYLRNCFNFYCLLDLCLKIIVLVLVSYLGMLLIENIFLSNRVKNQVDKMTVRLGEKIQKVIFQKKEIKKLLLLKEDFLKVVNHQLRTPAAIVAGLISVLEEGGLGKIEQKTIAKKLQIASFRLNSILDDILLAQNLEEHCKRTNLKYFKISEVIEKIIRKFAGQAKQRKNKIVFKKPNKEPAVFADKLLTEAVLFRLVENALAYTEKGKIEIIVKKQTEKGAKFFVICGIKDTGIGLLPKDKRHMFKLFYRGKQAMLEQPNGSGMGLYIAKRLAQAQGGDLVFASSGKNKGAKFTLSFPLPL